ncbi:MAG: DUF255 domain-containing protein [Nitrospirae bacterium]|nr:DUF255 domain-containing protein [Nitrospirota bacterium]
MSGGLVRWREWGEDVFEDARKHDKLLILDISAVWCHWCHVMDETSYSDPQVAGLINENFIPVRVDTDKMPDVNDRYNMGGWPTTAVLVPTGEVLIGATFIPPAKLIETLDGVLKFYSENRDELDGRIAELRANKALFRHAGLVHTALREDAGRQLRSYSQLRERIPTDGQAGIPRHGAEDARLHRWLAVGRKGVLPGQPGRGRGVLQAVSCNERGAQTPVCRHDDVHEPERAHGGRVHDSVGGAW